MKININDLEMMDRFDPNYNKNPLTTGLEDLNTPVKETFAGIALNKFGFAMDQLAEKNYPYSSPEAAVEAMLDMAFEDLSVEDFMAGIEADKPGVISRVWTSIKNFFKRIFDFIFGKGTSDRTSIRYYARLLKEKVAAMLGKGAQTPEEAKASAEKRAELFVKTKEIMDREKNTMDAKEGKVAGAGESEASITSPVEAMELLNKITPQIHLVGQLIADAMSESYTEASLNEKIVPRMNQIEKSYKEYEAALKSISMSSIGLEGLSQADLAKLYNQTTKFEMLWKQFESTRKLVDSINIEDMQRRMFSNDCINTLMAALRKVQSGVLTIRSVVRALIGKISSGNETQDYYDDIFDYYAYSDGTEGDLVKVALGLTAGALGTYALLTLIDKIWAWFTKKGSTQIEAAAKEVKASQESTVNALKEVKKVANSLPTPPKTKPVKILNYTILAGSRSPLPEMKTVLLGISSIMNNIKAGNFNGILGRLSLKGNITSLQLLTNDVLSAKEEVNLDEKVTDANFINGLMESIVLTCKDFCDISRAVKEFDKYVGMKPPQDKFDALPKDKQDAITEYLNNLPREMTTIINLYKQIKNEIVKSNKIVRDSMLGFMSVDTKAGWGGAPIKGHVRDIIDNTALESEEYIELKYLIEQYQLACESEEFFGLESGNDKPGLIKRIWNAIVKFFRKIWSKITSQGYRGKEAVIWTNTRINSGYEDEKVDGIPLKYAKEFEKYVNTYISDVQILDLLVMKEFNRLKQEPTNENLSHLNDILGSQIKAWEASLKDTSVSIPRSEITAKELLESMTKFEISQNDLIKNVKKFPPFQFTISSDDFPNLDPNRLNKTFNLMAILNKLVDRAYVYQEAVRLAIHSYNIETKLSGGSFVKVFGPKDRDKAKYKYKELEDGSESNQLDYLLSL